MKYHRLSYRFCWWYFCLPILLLLLENVEIIMSCCESSSSCSSSSSAAKTDDDVHPKQQQQYEFPTTEPEPESESGPEQLPHCEETEITTSTTTTETNNNNKPEGEVTIPRRRRRNFPIDSSLQEPTTTNICNDDNLGKTGDDDHQSDHLLKEEGEEEEVAVGTHHHHHHSIQVIDEYTTIHGDTLIELFGPTDIENSAPIIITIGHGGKLKPDYVQNRSKGYRNCNNKKSGNSCSMLSDLYTDEIGYKLAKQIIIDSDNERFDIIDKNNNNNNNKKKKRLIPYLIMNHLHRSKLDVNRNVDVAAQGDPIAEHAWYTYHNFIYQAQIKLMQVYGTIQGKKRRRRKLSRSTCTTLSYKEDYDDDDDDNDDNNDEIYIEGIPGLLIDIHGYGGKNYRRKDDGNSNSSSSSSSSSPPPFIHWGYGLKKQDFSSSTNDNCSSLDATKSTFEFASSLRSGDDGDIESLISGPLSLGSRFYNEFKKIRNSNNNNNNISTTNSKNILNDDDDDMIEKSNHHHLLGIGLPSYEYPNPNNITNDRNWCDINMTCPYFSGGYTTLAHTYLDWQQQYDQQKQVRHDDNKLLSDVVANDKGNDKNKQQQQQKCSIRMNTVQIEIPKQIRFGMNDDGSKGSRNQIHNDFCNTLSKSLIDFIRDVFGRERANTSNLLTTGKDDDDTFRKNGNNIVGYEEDGKLPEFTLSSKL